MRVRVCSSHDGRDTRVYHTFGSFPSRSLEFLANHERMVSLAKCVGKPSSADDWMYTNHLILRTFYLLQMDGQRACEKADDSHGPGNNQHLLHFVPDFARSHVITNVFFSDTSSLFRWLTANKSE